MKLEYANLKQHKLLLKNIISGPAPSGRILNYLLLTGKGILKHKHGFRALNLKDNIGSAWCTEFMVGLGLVSYDDSVEKSSYDLMLTEKGEKLYILLKDVEFTFDENDDKKCKKQVFSANIEIYNEFEKIFRESVVYKNLVAYIMNNDKYIYNSSDFQNDYFSFFMKLYNNEEAKYDISATSATTGGNRVPSLLQLCEFFDYVQNYNSNIIFNVKKMCEEKEDYSYNFEDVDNQKNLVLNEEINFEYNDDSLPELSERKNKIYPLNQILYGAPGTGKTYSTAEYAIGIIENKLVDIKLLSNDERRTVLKKYHKFVSKGQIVFTTFHQNYSYEDFIQGLRPKTDSSNIEFEVVDGIFKKISDKALRDPNNNYVLIIDEINRANMSKVLGELITLLEEDKRWGEINQLEIKLPYGEKFVVPNNLYILGTMNTADKSISLIDMALRRRFVFIENIVNLDFVKDQILRDILDKINSHLFNEFKSTDLLVGHAYFMNKTSDDLVDLMNNSIIPLLYEYYFDNVNKVRNLIETVFQDKNYDISLGKTSRIKIKKKE